VRTPSAPKLDPRRASRFEVELQERARAWLPSWAFADAEGDVAQALLRVAARFSAEVAERLDRAGEKLRRGFLDWLATRGEAARPARVPVVFKLAATARRAVFAEAPVRLQGDAAGTPVILETETDVRLVPGRLDAMVGADADGDAFYLPPPGLSSLDPLEGLPTQWRLKAFAAAGVRTLQLDPELGLAPGIIVEAGGKQYRMQAVDKGIATVDPPLDEDVPSGASVRKVTTFAPFDGARTGQEHALYLGHPELLDIEAATTLEVVGAQGLRADVAWQYWGKNEAKVEDWQPLTLAPDREQVSGSAVLRKPKGAVEPHPVNGISTRWIRAYRKTVPATAEPFTADELGLRINSAGCGQGGPPCSPTEETQSPAAEAMANTTPLVLDSVFFPLGKEPRQFDAFYLGSPEAFSKKGAEVQLCFEMADPTFAALARAPGIWPNILAGLGRDRALHLLQFDAGTGSLQKLREREPLQPPLPALPGTTPSPNPVALDRQPRWRLPMWTEADLDLLVATTAGGDVWIWREDSLVQSNSGWLSWGSFPATTPPATRAVDGLIYLADGAAPQMVALREGRLFVRAWPGGPQWTEVATEEAGNPVVLTAIVPILVLSGGELVTSAALPVGMVGVADDDTLYTVTLAGQCTQISPTDFDASVPPVAVQNPADGRLVVAMRRRSQPEIITFHALYGESTAPLEAGARVLGFDAIISGGALHLLASVRLEGGDYLASWQPHTAVGGPTVLFRAMIPPGTGVPGGAPTAIAQHVIVPGAQADVLVAPFDLTQRLALTADVGAGIVAPASTPAFQRDDAVTIDMGPPFLRRRIVEAPTTKDNEVLYPIDQPFDPGARGALYGFHSATPATLSGRVDHAAATLDLHANDHETVQGALLLIDTTVYRVTAVNLVMGVRVATLDPQPPVDIAAASYWTPVAINGRLAPYIRFTPANNNWDAALLDRATLVFPNATPRLQKGKAFSVGLGNRPLLVVLDQHWTTVPVPDLAAAFVLDAVVGSWTRLLGDTSTNPELSWEYWNGKGWWKLDVTLDDTLHMKTTGAVQFKVPIDIASSDWVGKTSYWIRARLIGGDYGREKVTVTTSPTASPGVTEQTITRSSEGIRPPSVVKLHIAYRMCETVRPTYVLVQDSGSIRDQSDANRRAGAIVEAFVPLAVTLGRLSSALASPPAPEECPPDCACPPEPGAPASASGTSPAPPAPSAAAPSAVTPPHATGRAIFIGLDTTLSEAPVNILLLVEERRHDALAPMAIETLVADHFVPVVTHDATRALGESGVLSMAFAVPPTRWELFGMSRTWLRLAPAWGGDASQWKPAIRGAYLNATWASARETLTRELLGSSEGAPNLVLYLARPPVLRHTLELRVKEPLGEEEAKQLRAADASRVLSAVENLPGDWVRWDETVDPGDESAAARVYALDEGTGEIRFGDGRHGAIPPIGRDAIVAFQYQRTEAGPADADTVPGNSIAARTPLNLVSPVESVETVVAADQAAGGAPAEVDERVVRFGTARLRHRGRAVTSRDLQDLALQSSPDFVQARSFAAPGHTRLVVVMRGRDPQPTAAQRRELRRLLLAAGPVSLGAPGALQIGGPRVRRLRITVALTVASLDDAGGVAREVNERITALFDTATGDVDRDGWALGKDPSEDDIALALAGTPRLEGLGAVKLYEVGPDGLERPWPGGVKGTDLVMLDDDFVRLEFRPVEVVA